MTNFYYFYYSYFLSIFKHTVLTATLIPPDELEDFTFLAFVKAEPGRIIF